MYKVSRFVMSFTLVAMVFVGALGFVAAQDTSAGTVQCDSDLILNLYIADRFFGFNRVRDQLLAAGADPSTFVDLNTINKGQYTPWFDSAMMGGMTGAAGSTETGVSPTTIIGLNEQQLGTVSSGLMMDDASRQQMMDQTATGMGVDTTMLTQLAPSAVAGEPAECSQLRTELNRFYSTVAFNDFSGTFSAISGATGTTTDPNAVAPVDPNAAAPVDPNAVPADPNAVPTVASP